MSLTIERDALLATIQAVSASVPRGANPIPILKHLRLEASAGSLSLTANDLITSTETHAAADVETPFACAAPAAELLRLVKSMAKGAHLKLSTNAHYLTLGHGSSTYRLPVLPADDFPPARTLDGGVKIELGADDIRHLFVRPASAISDETTRYYLCGIYLHAVDGKLAACATNGVSLIRTVSDAAAPADMLRVIVPTATVDRLVSLGDDGGTLSWSDIAIGFDVGDVRFRSQLVAGTFPDYERVIPEESKSFLAVDRADMLAAISRLDLLREDKSTIEFNWGDDPTEIELTTSGTGEGSERIECKAKGLAAGTLATPSHQLAPTVGAFSGATLHIHLPKPDPRQPQWTSNAFLLLDPDDPSITAVEMPCRPVKERVKAAA